MFCLGIAIIWVCIVHIQQIQSDVTLRRMLSTDFKISNHIHERIRELDFFVGKVERKFHKLLSLKWSPMDKGDYISTPLTAMVMVRRLVQDWPSLVTMTGKISKLNQVQLDHLKWPTTKQLKEAARSMMRSQMTYEMDTALLVQGVQRDTFLTNFTAADSLELARQYFKHRLNDEAIEWLQHALSGLQDGDDAAIRDTVHYYMAAALCISGDARRSSFIIRRILEENIRSQPPSYLLTDIFTVIGPRECMDEAGRDYEYTDSIYRGISADSRTSSFFSDVEYSKHHGKLCRGEGKIDHNLRCRYLHYHQPHLRFQPFKLEELHLDPPVVRFHDLITDKEAESLMTEAKDIVKPSTVGAETRIVTEYRSSFVAWLERDELDWLDHRISQVTRLNMQRAEDHQVSRYGVSGEYLPHTDNLDLEFADDRIATVMIYLNDVEQGGNTVFIDWNVSVPPVKNSALFWFNFEPNGNPDLTSIHSGCPVLKGTKWVLNKWILNGDNDIYYPCTLNRKGSFKGFYI